MTNHQRSKSVLETKPFMIVFTGIVIYSGFCALGYYLNPSPCAKAIAEMAESSKKATEALPLLENPWTENEYAKLAQKNKEASDEVDRVCLGH